MNQAGRNARAAVKLDPHVDNRALAAANNQPRLRIGRPAAESLQHLFQLVSLEYRDWWRILRRLIEHLDSVQGKWKRKVVSQMNLVRKIEMRPIGERRRLERIAHSQ